MKFFKKASATYIKKIDLLSINDGFKTHLVSIGGRKAVVRCTSTPDYTFWLYFWLDSEDKVSWYNKYQMRKCVNRRSEHILEQILLTNRNNIRSIVTLKA